MTLLASFGVALLARIIDDLGPSDQDPDEIRRQACDLTATESSCAPSPPPTLPELNPDSQGGGGIGSGLDIITLLLWLALIALVGFALYLLLRSLLGRSWSAGTDEDEGDDDGSGDEVEPITPMAIDRTREPRDWRHEAEEHRRAGRFRDSLRCRYRALVGDLARGGVIDEIPGRTTGEERAQLRRNRPAAATSFSGAADLFDAAWYGALPVDTADDDRFQQLEELVLHEAGR